MATAARQVKPQEVATETVAAALARMTAEVMKASMPAEVIDKARGCLTDFVACVLESRNLPWGKCVLEYAGLGPRGPSAVVGTALKIAAPEAAFANGTLGHGLVREDMHVPSCSHLGVVVWPTLLALAEMEEDKGRPVSGERLLKAGVIGYEVAARVGRALFDAELAARIRPTGTIGAIGAAAAGAALLNLDREQTTSAIAFGANGASGLNEWPWAGGWDMFFHAGQAARSAVTSVLLARSGAFGSPSAIEGRAGLFAAYGRRELSARIKTGMPDAFEIMTVYWKPAPACNYVQTPCQAALELVNEGVKAGEIERIEVASFTEAVQYPGCDHAGPFGSILEAKMSIQYSVAATFVTGAMEEANYKRLDDPEIARLAKRVVLSLDPDLEKAYPNHQGVGITVTLKDGSRRSMRLADLTPCDHEGVRTRFRKVGAEQLDAGAAGAILEAIDGLEKANDLRALSKALAAR